MALTGEKGSTDGRLLRDVVAGVVEEVAPEERPLLDALWELDDATVLRRLTVRGDRDHPLSFGVEAVTALVISVVWIAMDQTIRRIVDGTGSQKRARPRLFGRRRDSGPVTIPPLTQEQLQQVYQEVLDAARSAGFSPKRSGQIADGVVRRLALAPPEAQDGQAAPTAP